MDQGRQAGDVLDTVDLGAGAASGIADPLAGEKLVNSLVKDGEVSEETLEVRSSGCRGRPERVISGAGRGDPYGKRTSGAPVRRRTGVYLQLPRSPKRKFWIHKAGLILRRQVQLRRQKGRPCVIRADLGHIREGSG